MPTPMVAWANLTKEEFQQWKIHPEVGQSIMDFNTPKKTSSFKTPSTLSSLMSNESYQELIAFKKAAERDMSAFDILRDEKYFDVFHRSLKATAMTQGLSNVCDPNFNPKRGDPHEQQRLTEKQNLVYAVLLKTLQTDYSRALVREHEHDKDAQQILYELHQHHTDSELSRAEVLRLTTYVANVKLTDNWRGTTTQFLLHFKEQVRLLDILVPLDEQLPDSTRMAFLQRAVEGVPDLRRVRILDGVMTAKSGSFTTMKDNTSFYNMHPSIMMRPFQKAPEGTKSRPMRYSLSLLKRLMITIPLLKMIPSPQSRKIS